MNSVSCAGLYRSFSQKSIAVNVTVVKIYLLFNSRFSVLQENWAFPANSGKERWPVKERQPCGSDHRDGVFDTMHGQNGVAVTNAMELHPILDVEFL